MYKESVISFDAFKEICLSISKKYKCIIDTYQDIKQDLYYCIFIKDNKYIGQIKSIEGKWYYNTYIIETTPIKCYTLAMALDYIQNDLK